jgi:hypothetical protein
MLTGLALSFSLSREIQMAWDVNLELSVTQNRLVHSGNTYVCMNVCTAWDAATLPTQADLMAPPDDGYNSPQLSVEVGVFSIEAYRRGYVAIEALTPHAIGNGLALILKISHLARLLASSLVGLT